MPKTYKRDCDYCGTYYEGHGRRCCSVDCADALKRIPKEPNPERVAQNEELLLIEGKDAMTVTVLASKSIKTVAGLIEAAEIDLDEWEVFGGKAKKYDGMMKLKTNGEDTPVIVPLHYVSVSFKRYAASLFDLTPKVLKVTRPKLAKSKPAPFTTVHYSDLHIPYHDPRCMNILYQIIDYTNPDITVDHGDTVDCHEISKYEKNPLHRISLQEELDATAIHHGTVHSLTPNAEHKWLLGNHEDRMRRLVWKLADNRAGGELLTLRDVQDAIRLESLTGIEDLGWTVTPYPKHELLFDRLILCHGNTVRADSGASGKSEYNKYRKSGMSGHTHRRGVYEHKDYDGVNAWWEMGCLCLLEQEYTEQPNWQQGFNVVTWSEDRKNFGVEEVRIHDGVTYFRGRRFVGDSREFGELAA